MKNQTLLLLLLPLFFLMSCEKNTAPTCEIILPTNNSIIVKGIPTVISVTAEDENDNLKEVRFFIDGVGIGSSSSFPFSYTWNTESATEGSHTLTATAVDSEGAEASDNITITVVTAPEADFIASQTVVGLGESINFTDESTGNPTEWAWNFGDGNTSANQNPSHTYSTLGTYTVQLTIINENGTDTETKTNYISVVEASPVADFSANTTNVTTGVSINFTDLSTNTPQSWSWDFGDGNTSVLQNPSHSYNSIGTYSIVLTVSNNHGSDTETKSDYITVGDAPIADFVANQTSITEGETVSFTDQSTGNPTSWSWDFGDGNTSSEQNPSYTYNSYGTYQVNLTVTNDYGSNSELKTDFIVVNCSSVTDIGGNIYSTITIGDQCWMAENLKYLPSVVGTGTSSGSIAYYYVYGYDGTNVTDAKATENYNTYGVLYNWSAAMAGSTSSTDNPSGVQGICPDGWHIPSDNEWIELEISLGMSQEVANNTGNRGTNEASKLAGNSSLWNSGSLEDNVDFGLSGFNALPSGHLFSFSGTFYELNTRCYFWSTSDDGFGSYIWYRELSSSDTRIDRNTGSGNKSNGFSIRCLKD